MNNKMIFLPILGAIMLASGCTASSSENDKESTERIVPISTLMHMDTTIFKEYIADIQAHRNIELRSRLSGFLDKIYVDEGAYVRKGQVLFQVNSEEYKADYAHAEAGLDNARAEAKKVELELERTKKLVKKNIVSNTEIDLMEAQLNAAKSKIKEAQALVAQAKTKLTYTEIRAPFAGRIDRILLKEGSLLEEGALLTNISDNNSVNVYFSISEPEYLAIASDGKFNGNSFKSEVRLILANGTLYPHVGNAEIVESEFEATTGSIALRAKFPNPDALLKHGASGKVAVPTKTGNLTFVHQKSVLEIQDKAYVYTVKDNKVKMTPFKSGQRIGHYYVVEEGLDKDVQVVFEGVQSLRDGMVISPRTITN
ncbi:efflux RND transporter periplasmic adaptor subunit [Sphingobacterium pedocola]|uniref:Efflux transporter periplasmic adaptor subunit n=1 Tax=Sphingobacterium pedocola TaxID=2082722 RepID=A0ABR9TCA6_9SPHI|nr:efflux RND transporter periplasmic adaptor subunit [Sphingobacterium pedocola]MBE8722998.1 efflux transporter periplasmic adaptor subunit [Sphingobacterium pedocola]